ncbi:MAG: alkaline phosphatase family protein [Bacteroidota bacterium]
MTLIFFVAICFFVACQKDTSIPAVNTTPASSSTTEVSNTTNQQATNTVTTTGAEAITANKMATAICCKTENVIIVVIDGARYSETWGDYTRQNIPNQFGLYFKGVMLTNFHNMGTTNTDSGHDAISTGNYEDLENNGHVLPQYPSIFQNFLKSSGKAAEKAWVVASKDKLQILGNCIQEDWKGRYTPRTDCGVDGLFSGYRSDDTTVAHAKNILGKYHPNLMLVNLKDPDYFGHSTSWNNYIKGIQSTDENIKDLYDFIQSDDNYRGKTTIIITNDHGRHLPGVADGFVSHGDGCEGCRHIQFLALGPDFKEGVGFQTPYEQIDISATVAKLLNFKMESSKGKVMTDLFK